MASKTKKNKNKSFVPEIIRLNDESVAVQLDKKTSNNLFFNKSSEESYIYDNINLNGMKKLNENSGTYNTVSTYKNVNNERVSIRQSKKPVFLIKKPKGSDQLAYYIILKKKQVPHLMDEVNDIINTRKNWFLASELEIAPKIFKYGFINYEIPELSRSSSGIVAYLYNYMESEGYISDLQTFYNNGPGKSIKENNMYQLTKTDKIIKKQIKNRLEKMNDIMNVTCFDIKPLNTVINYEIDQKSNVINIDVRLIDWDADFCIKFNEISLNTMRANNKNNLKIINNMLMAIHFYCFLNRNIFYEDFNGNKSVIHQGNKDFLKQLFCYNKDDFYFLSNYYHNSIHYFINSKCIQRHIRYSSKNEAINHEAKCEDFFTKVTQTIPVITSLSPRMTTIKSIISDEVKASKFLTWLNKENTYESNRLKSLNLDLGHEFDQFKKTANNLYNSEAYKSQSKRKRDSTNDQTNDQTNSKTNSKTKKNRRTNKFNSAFPSMSSKTSTLNDSYLDLDQLAIERNKYDLNVIDPYNGNKMLGNNYGYGIRGGKKKTRKNKKIKKKKTKARKKHKTGKKYSKKK